MSPRRKAVQKVPSHSQSQDRDLKVRERALEVRNGLPITIQIFIQRMCALLKSLVRREGLPLDELVGWIEEGIVEFRETANPLEKEEIDVNHLSPDTVLKMEVDVRKCVDRNRKAEGRHQRRYVTPGDEQWNECSVRDQLEDVEDRDFISAFESTLPQRLKETFAVLRMAILNTGDKPAPSDAAVALEVRVRTYHIRLRKIDEAFNRFAKEHGIIE